MDTNQSQYRVLGLMSGTSLDGLDIALCTFKLQDAKWQFSIEKARTFPYSKSWRSKLASAENLSGLDLLRLHNTYGKLMGNAILEFAQQDLPDVDFIASHGHTVFHQPQDGITLQIGSGAIIAAITKKTVVCDFRAMDVALGGQGAPLVPIGDKLLFHEFDYCLNLGGFANISFDTDGGDRRAFDICPVNIVLNHLVKSRDLDFDDQGNLGRIGNVNEDLLQQLNNLKFYHRTGPKSLGKEWVWEEVIPLIESFDALSLEDKLATYYQHILLQIETVTTHGSGKTMYVTGGGAFNVFLMDLFRKHLHPVVVLPGSEIINFKEALIFAFLGVLRVRGEVNCLKEVTGADKDSSGGVLFL